MSQKVSSKAESSHKGLSPADFCQADRSQSLGSRADLFEHAFDASGDNLFSNETPLDPGSIPLLDASDEPISFLSFMQVLLSTMQVAHTGLGRFIKLSMQPASRSVHRTARSSDLWPCPMPGRHSWTGNSKLSPRRRRRHKLHVVKAQLLQAVVGVLNWETLGHPSKPPPQACFGCEFTTDQWLMIQRLERLVDYFLRPGPIAASSLGRSGEKFNLLLRATQELPSIGIVDLDELVTNLASVFDPYSKPSGCSSFGASGCPASFHGDQGSTSTVSSKSDPSDRKVPLSATVAKPVIASRIKWEHSPQFDPEPFFDDQIVREAFKDPSSARLPEELWPEKPRGKVHCTKGELLELAAKWDSKGACKIFRIDQVDFSECVGMFAVPKDSTHDRLILNPQKANSRMSSFSHYTKELAPGSMFSLLRLPEGKQLRLSADDLAEMYYTFKIPPARAKRNSIGRKFQAEELSHLNCFDASQHYGTCVIALNALAMGDSWAVEFAQQSHCNVLRILAGCMLDRERVCYRRPFPRTSFVEWLAIDDHVGAQVVTPKQFRVCAPLRDTEVFDKAEKAYKQVGLIQHSKKKLRNVSHGTFLGAEVDGIQGFVSSPRHRIGALMLCTMLIVQRGSATPRILASVLGCWIHALMFRRPLLSVLSHSFTDGRGLAQDQVFALAPETRNELMAIALLGPVCITDLRVDIAPFVYCTDASPSGAGICKADETPLAVEELWRHCEQRGFYTQLLNPAAEILAGLDESFEEPVTRLPDQTSFPEKISIPVSLPEGIVYDCLELFRGEGNWSLAHGSIGFNVHGGLDIKGNNLAFADLMDNSTFHQVASLAARGVVRDWHAGPPCETYGTLRRPRIRSKSQPAGFRPQDPFTRLHTLLALRTAFLMNLVLSSGGFFSVEQPRASIMFYLEAFKRLVFRGCVITHMCFCAFGSPFMKPSKWLHNKPWMIDLEQPCRCASKADHFIIEGSFTKASVVQFEAMCRPSSAEVYGRPPRVGEAVSAYSASYPKPLCRKIAAGAWKAVHDVAPVIPLSAHLLSQRRIGMPSIVPAQVLREPLADPRPFYEDPEWVEELADSLPFRELLRYKFKRQGHINVLECRVHKTLMKHAAKHHPNSRFVSLLDSRVTLGATAKGRSSSRALCRVLQGSLGYIIGGGLYPGGMHVPSSKNKSDAPSRNRPVPAPSKELPEWLLALRRGHYDRFDRVREASRCVRLPGRWLRLLLLMAGDIEPNPGPRRRAQVPRGPLDMSVGFTTITSRRMELCLRGFEEWLQAELSISLDDIAWDYTAAPLALRAFGMHLFASGEPRYKFVYTITAMQDTYPHLRPFFSSAWNVDRKWQQHEPGECRPVLSAPVIQAMTTVCLLWGWYRWIGVTLIGFLGMLHPAEFINLKRADLLLPADSLVQKPVLYVHIRHPKTARFARRQHCKIDDSTVLEFVTVVFGALNPEAQLFQGGSAAYRRRWNLVLEKLHIPSTLEFSGATPGVLRGSGATYLYLQHEDLSLVQWRGRWAQIKTVEHYIQEVAAQSMIARLPQASRGIVKIFSEAAAALLHQFLVDRSKE